MSSSAINSQIAQLKISSVQNQADTSSVYNNGVWDFKNASAVTSVRIDASGNVGIGTTPSVFGSYYPTIQANPPASFVLAAKANDIEVGSNYVKDNTFTSRYVTSGQGAALFAVSGPQSNGAFTWLTASSGTAGNTITWSERMRIDASGNLLVGKTVSSDSLAEGFIVYNNTIAGGGIITTTTNNASSGVFTYHLYNRNATFNGYRFYVGVDGGIRNFSANNSSLSDERVKTDIKPAGSYLQKICSIPVKTFRYKDQGDDMDLTLGVIAQEVEAIAPELVNATDGFGDLPEDGVPLKTVYQTDLQYALMKCIQELKEKNDALEARLAALEAKP